MSITGCTGRRLVVRLLECCKISLFLLVGGYMGICFNYALECILMFCALLCMVVIFDNKRSLVNKNQNCVCLLTVN